MRTIRLRYGPHGLERWNDFTGEWYLVVFHVNLMSRRELGEYFAGREIVWEPAV